MNDSDPTTHDHPGLLISSAVNVAVPAAVAAGVVLDWGQDPRWRSAVVRMTVRPDGPARTGQRVVEELRFAGLTFTTPTEIVEAGRWHAAYAGTGGAVTVTGTRRVEPVGARSCRVVTGLRLRGHGPMRPLVRVLLASYRRHDAADLRRLAALLEAEQGAGGPVGSTARTT